MDQWMIQRIIQSKSAEHPSEKDSHMQGANIA